MAVVSSAVAAAVEVYELGAAVGDGGGIAEGGGAGELTSPPKRRPGRRNF